VFPSVVLLWRPVSNTHAGPSGTTLALAGTEDEAEGEGPYGLSTEA